MSDSRAEDILQRALDIWDEPTEERPRVSSGKFPAGTAPRTSSMPPPLPRESRPSIAPTTLASVHKRIKDVENDVVFVIEATSKRLDALEDRHRAVLGAIDSMAERLEAMESWGAEMRESLETWGAELARTTTERADEVDEELAALNRRVTSLDTRTELQLEELSEAVGADAPAGFEELAGQLDRLLAQVSIWRAEYEALTKS